MLVSQISQVMADGLRHCLLRTAVEAPHRLDDGPGVVLLSKEWEIFDANPAAERWLSLVSSSTGWSTVVRSVAERTRIESGVVTIPIRTQTGHLLLLHGSRASSGAVAVIVEEVRLIQLTEVISSYYGLTPRERTLTECIPQGRSTKENIVKTQNISVHDSRPPEVNLREDQRSKPR